MERLVTTEEAARQFGVSRSTIKRFCDQNGQIVRRTPGGHRRIDYQLLADAMHSHSKYACRKLKQFASFEETLLLLIDGNSARLLQLILDATRTPDEWLPILEQSLVPALWRVGEMWQKNLLPVSGEKVATNTASVLLDALISRIEIIDGSSKRTIVGGSFLGCQDTIASKLITLGARASGIHAVELGCNCSPEHLAEAQARLGAYALWVCHTHIAAVQDAVSQHDQLASLKPRDVDVYIGGGALTPSIRSQLKGTIYCETIEQMIDHLLE